jgi:DNA replication and repair protein RecF
MLISTISIKNFRIHSDTAITFSDKTNYIVGGNGQGKTSIIEAIYYLCTTKNYKTSSDSEIVQFNKNDFEVGGNFKDLSEDKIRIYFSLTDNKKYYLQNGKQISRPSEIIGKYPIVLLTPDDHALTQGYPADRRKFVDSIISQASEVYLKTLLDYNKTLRQRANLLYQIRDGKKNNHYSELEAWNENLTNSGSELIRYRKNFISDFNNFISDSYKEIMDKEELPEIQYFYLDGIENNFETVFRDLLKEKIDEEIRRASNLVGPHRDEFIFKVNNSSLRTYGSQGQHKTFQVALRFAQFFYMKEKLGRTPIFLLDDVFGELDKKRSIKISEYLKKVGQAFITITDFSNYSFLNKSANDLTVLINDGKVNAYA